MPIKILLIDDDKNLAELILDRLVEEGYKTSTASTGEDGISKFKDFRPDLVLLDWRLPDKDGVEICRMLKSGAGKCPPIIMLSGLARESDKVSSLESGADDYLTKPFSMNELVARIRVQLRKPSPTQGPLSMQTIQAGDLVLNPSQRSLTLKGIPIELPPKAFALLHALLESKEKVLGRDVLMEKVWGHEYLDNSRVVDVHIANLRKKLKDYGRFVVTVERVGYKFSMEG